MARVRIRRANGSQATGAKGRVRRTLAASSGIRVGISGWTYAPWRGVFFPRGLRQKDELAYASGRFNSIEINGTFYALQRPESYRSWYAQTPGAFVFSVKAPRFITHIRRLKDVGPALANFFASGLLELREKLGPLLWQLPPSFAFDPGRLRDFFALLPRSTAAASRLAARHDSHVRLTGWPAGAGDRPIRHALEVRHASFQTPEFLSLLRANDVALVVADTAGKWPIFEDVTSSFVYVRLHGDSELYVSGYTPSALKAWASKVASWHEGRKPAAPGVHRAGPPPAGRSRDVFVYFDNDVKTRAPFDAMRLAHRLGIGPRPDPVPRGGRGLETARDHWPPIRTRRATGSRSAAKA